MQQKIFSEDKIKYYVAMAQLATVSPLFKAKLFEYFDFDIVKAFTCEKTDLSDFNEKYPNVPVSRNFFNLRKTVNIDEAFEYALSSKYKILTYEDENYPKLLKEIEDFPLMLFYKGDLKNVNFDKTLAVVGSRRASTGAKEALSNIISSMANSNVTIVSGLAYGIDATAHRAAIKSGLKTIGVVGAGLNFCYPDSNKDLYKKIEEGYGVVFSEFPPKMPPLPQNFPQRNRIVTGLSFGTLVAEAAIKSGAMISANLTLEQNRELMCMPGLISNPNCEGIYHLLKNGAGLVTCANDVFEHLNWDIKEGKTEIELSKDEKNIYDTIALEPKSFDIISNEVQMDTAFLMVCLTQMELKGLIKQINSKYYISD